MLFLKAATILALSLPWIAKAMASGSVPAPFSTGHTVFCIVLQNSTINTASKAAVVVKAVVQSLFSDAAPHAQHSLNPVSVMAEGTLNSAPIAVHFPLEIPSYLVSSEEPEEGVVLAKGQNLLSRANPPLIPDNLLPLKVYPLTASKPAASAATVSLSKTRKEQEEERNDMQNISQQRRFRARSEFGKGGG